MEEVVQTDSDSEATRNGTDQLNTAVTGQSRDQVELAVAFAYASSRNTTSAVVGADVDATGTLAVSAVTDYPPPNGDVNGSFDPAVLIADTGLDGLALFLAGDLGLAVDLFNSSVVTLAGNPGDATADKYVVAAGIDIDLFTDAATARIDAGTPVDQDRDYQGFNQGVAVDATNSGLLINVDDQSALNLGIGGGIEALDPLLKSGNLKGALFYLANPLGLSGQNVVGPAVIETTVANTTTAQVQTGATVRTGPGPGGGLTVNAEDDLTDADVAQAGAKASSFGVTASVTRGTITDVTTADLAAGVGVTFGPVAVSANDTTDRYGIDGGYIAGQKSGVGVGVNTVTRTTQASVGSATPTGLPPAGGLAVDVPNVAVSVEAADHGYIFALGIAGVTLTEATNAKTAA